LNNSNLNKEEEIKFEENEILEFPVQISRRLKNFVCITSPFYIIERVKFHQNYF
jgi:hypothetical protein